jgi:hypothetical protein
MYRTVEQQPPAAPWFVYDSNHDLSREQVQDRDQLASGVKQQALGVHVE